MKIFSYRTIKGPAEGIYKEKGSKFLSFAYPVKSEEEVKQTIIELKKKYFDERKVIYKSRKACITLIISIHKVISSYRLS